MLRVLSKIYLYIIFAFLYFPIAIMIIFSFNNSMSRVQWSGFTLKWYKSLFGNAEILTALKNTIIVALISSILATIIGTIAAVGILRMHKTIRHFLITITNLPMISPEIVTGVSLMLLFVSAYKHIGILAPGLLTLILAHVTFSVPYVVLSVMPKLRQLNPHIYEAARDLGCPPVRAFLKVVIPDIIPGVLTGMIIVFTLSIDDFIISYFTCGHIQTLPIEIYSRLRRTGSPEINALSTLLFVTVLGLLFIVNFRQGKTGKPRKPEIGIEEDQSS